jgi:hypothetical protein
LQVRNKKGTSVIDIQNIPIAEMGTLLLGLMEHVPPGSELRRAEQTLPSA